MATLKGAIGMIPCVGSLAAEVFGVYLVPPYQKRQQAWMEDVSALIADLAQEGLPKETLQSDQFVDAVLQATPIALRNSSEEKRKALLAAIRSVASSQSPSETETAMFFQLVDRFTPWHLKLLDYFRDPIQRLVEMGRFPETIRQQLFGSLVEAGLAELRGQELLYRRIFKELADEELIERKCDIVNRGRIEHMKGNWLTPRGRQFLQFVGHPPTVTPTYVLVS
jgi:hypothetical protein